MRTDEETPSLRGPGPEFGAAIGFDDEREDEAERQQAVDLWLDPAAVLNRMAREGDPVPCGWAPLDARLRRGGLTPGAIYTFGGPPFTGKTTIVIDIALGLAQRIPVFALFSDEGRTQAAVRMAVMLGIPIDEVEEHPAGAAERLALALGERSLYLMKPDHDTSNASDLYDYVTSRVPRGETAAVILDSVQTIPPHGNVDGRENDYQTYKRFMRVVRNRTESDGRITLLTSQSNRASYRARRAEDNTVAISSFAGGGIEYGFDFGAVLSLPEESSKIVCVKVVKNRKGHFNPAHVLPEAFNIRFDPARGRMLEVDQAEMDAANTTAATTRLAPVCTAIEDLLDGRELSGSEIGRQLLGRGAGFGTSNIRAALRHCVENKKSVTEHYRQGKGGGYYYTLRFSKKEANA